MDNLGPWLILFLPLISAAAIAFGLHKNAKLSIGVSLAAVWTSFAIAASYLPDVLAGGGDFLLSDSIVWMQAGGFQFHYGLMIDGLTMIMLMVVLGVGGLIHIYSIGYMKGDEGIARFFGCLSLFIFSMLGIVLSDNFFQVFIHWELVGVSSYLLIGYYYRKPSASAASNKAFLTNRVGDFGFMIGILMLVFATGTASFSEMGAIVNDGDFLQRTFFEVGGASGWVMTGEHFLWVAGALVL
ncbi:MAG: NADH-quinone oxidoreductase subunit L, partial [Pseudohongiellaceae bacterium]